ncbi:MAG: hypothetical protein V7K32_16875 [Nostoc sp.]|uniref:beta strand repeat-containing protein n=1 Tax=Nostoc sp. TaxID=1180 RepID=UPI002FF895CE
MVSANKSLNKQRQRYQSLVATALLTGSLFQFIAPALADGTAGGQSISNTATATYEDPNTPGTSINATSNTVTVTVAEVAGITVTASGVTDNNGGTVAVNDLLTYTYTLTNVGNDPTKFHIPNQATTTGPGTVSGVLPADKTGAVPASGTLQYSTDGGATWTNVAAGGVDTPSIPVSGTVLVRVPVTVQAGAVSGDIVKVTLGNTPGDAQNQLRSPDGGDVYTVDNADGSPGEVAGAPINGTREASITQQILVGNTVKTVALATILKTRTAYSAGDATVLNDDLLTYGLSLRVESSDVTNTGLTPAALAGTTIKVDGASVTRILVSDALPASTTLNATPTAPPGWIVVYTIDDPATITADNAQWTTTAPGTLSTVKRVGFINNPASISTVATGTTLTGFTVQVKTTGITATTPTNVNNVAQVFGKTAGNPASALIVDDSGDQNPGNFNAATGTFTTTPDSGYYPGTVPAAQTDTGNNNQGTNSITGDVNVYTVSVAQSNSILNGPNSAPDATGPSGLTNDDFTNKSSFVAPNTAPGSTVDPQSVGFTNTIKNNGTSPNDITIVPTPPASKTDLPNNTKVTVTYNSVSAVYNYDSATGAFTLTSGTAVKVLAVAPGASVNYGVEVDLPAGTKLSTDTGKGFPLSVAALIDTNGNGVVDTGEVNNISIDRVYTGFLQLVKVSRVLQGTGPAVGAGQGDFESTPAYTNPVTNTVVDPNPAVTDVARNPAPGNIIEYQIRYKNISDAQAGTGNVILNADKVVITEDGTLGSGGNNWALDNDNNTQIDTSNIVGSAKDSGASTIQFFSGKPATTPGTDQTGTTVSTDVSKYVNTATGQVAPGIQRTFTFQRKVN